MYVEGKLCLAYLITKKDKQMLFQSKLELEKIDEISISISPL